MNLIIRFVFGLAVGSFLNVLALRYDPDTFLLSGKVIRGRSHCPKCKHKLAWYELAPLLSFALQGGRCSHCKAKISFLYPLGELISGLIFAFVPEYLAAAAYPPPGFFSPQVLIWIAVFLLLQLLSLIDYRLQMVPDEGSLLLIILGALASFAYPLKILGLKVFSFVGHYAYLFGFQDSIWSNRLFGVIVALLFFGVLVLITRGRGMGFGDLKLSLGLGLVFGWPDAALLLGFAFILGAAAGAFLLLFKHRTMKNTVPFVPFLALGAALLFFFGYPIIQFYFGLIYI